MDELQLRESLQTMNQQQAANHFGVHLATVKRAIKRLGIEYTKKSGGHPLYRDNPLDQNVELTEKQKDIMVGSLLGDGYIMNSHRFRIKQKESRREYVEYLHEQFSPFSTPIRVDRSRKPTRLSDGSVSHKLEDWKGEYAWAASFSTRKHRIFKELREKWYPDGEKIIPSDVILNPTVLTHWFLQDGSYSKKFKMVRFSCQSFSENDIVRLIKLLHGMGIQSTLSKNQSYDVIDVYSDHLKVLNHLTLKPACFEYKLKKA